ncbi:MARCKS-related protein [Alligator mississippiensis]|uniref:MARCKS-related protein n=1 Tax=Alligator mississippiensis TaxID=8496 RepID=A0A151MMV8_ALLMI|nr:MARCKS-related protein [Alligator mississippiensis]KYO25854.1 MARCKS-related protein [Alligator mississippiensis]
MGSQGSKAAKGDVIAQKSAEAVSVSPSKSNGQENGHVKINGDMSPKADGEAPPLNGNGSAEPVKEEAKAESASGDVIEPAPAAEGGEAKPEGAAPCKETPNKKKKKFSFKKSFKLSGISFRKNKKEGGDSSVSSPTDEQDKAEAKGEENPTCSTSETEQTTTTPEGKAEEKAAAAENSPAAPAAEGQQEVEPKREDEEAGETKEEQQPQAGDTQEEMAKPEEPSKPVEPEPSTTLAAAEQKEE